MRSKPDARDYDRIRDAKELRIEKNESGSPDHINNSIDFLAWRLRTEWKRRWFGNESYAIDRSYTRRTDDTFIEGLSRAG